MKRPTQFQYSAAAIIGVTLASVLWFARTPAHVETSAVPADQTRATRSAHQAAAGNKYLLSGKSLIRDTSQTAPDVEVVRLIPDQVLATVNMESIKLRHLIPVGKDETESVLTPEEYSSRLQRAIDIEVVLQAARNAGVDLTEAQQKRRDAIGAGSQAELAHYQKHGLSWSTTGPSQVEFEKRLLSAQMLEQNMVAKVSNLNPSPDLAIQSRYELARLDLLKQLHAAANVAITEPAIGPLTHLIMQTAFPFAVILAATASIAVGQVLTELPLVRSRVTVKSIPPFAPDGQPAPAVPPTIPGHPFSSPTGPPLASGLLAWDGDEKAATVRFGAAQASFIFQVNNVSPGPVTITSVQSSCGCTVAKLPQIPWTLIPGAKGTIDVVMNLAGKSGINIKNLIINTDRGFKTLTVRTNIQPPPAGAMGQTDRAKNLQIATANRQAILHGECAACHSMPAINKTGAELYQAACSICHEAVHCADSVPDLKKLQKQTDANYWRTWITSSVQGKLMPAFSIENGGILNPVQIDSLVKYLTENISSAPPASLAPTPSR